MFVFVSASLLDVGHHGSEALGVRAELTLEQTNENAAKGTDHQRPPPGVDACKCGVRNKVPNQVDSVVEQEEKKPHRRSSKCTNNECEERKDYAVDDRMTLGAERVKVVARRGLRLGRRL